MARSTHGRKRAVIEFLERVGEAAPMAIGAALGIPTEEQNALQKLLGRMEPRWLVRNGHGIYRLSRHYRKFALDNFDLTERAIERYLVERSEPADTDDIAKAVSVRRLAGGSRDPEHRRVTQTLKVSEKFCQPYGWGKWALTEEARERLPLLGKWADVDMQLAWFERNEQDGFDSWEAKRADFFRRVGAAFEQARGEVSLFEVVRDPDIAAALGMLGETAFEAQREILHATQDQLEDEAREQGVPVWPRVEAHQSEYLLANLLGEFERGDVRLHLVAPPGIYRACARRYRVCPARLSRGLVVLRDLESAARVGFK